MCASVRAWMRAWCVRACIHVRGRYLDRSRICSTFLIVVAKRERYIRPRDTCSFAKLRVYELDFTQRPDWAVSPEDSDEDEVASSSQTLAAEGAQREVSSVLLGLRQFTPQEVAVEGAFANGLLHRVHVNLQHSITCLSM